MTFARELAVTAVVASVLLPIAFLKAPEIADQLDPMPGAIAMDTPSIALIPIPLLKPMVMQ